MPQSEHTPEPTLDQWKNSPALQSELREVLQNPVLRTAIALLTRNSAPSARTGNLMTYTNDQMIRLHAWHTGYRDFAVDLERLAHQTPPGAPVEMAARPMGRAPDADPAVQRANPLGGWGEGLLDDDNDPL
jgi:hypothetical protein